MKLEISYEKKKQTWRLNQWANKEIKGEKQKCSETNEDGNTMVHSCRDAAEMVLSKKMAMQVCLKAPGLSLTRHLKELGKEQSPKLAEGT